MDYEKLYYTVIENAKADNRTKDNGLYEIHHIKPKAVGGSNSKHNLVHLTLREHYLVHYMLTKIYPESDKLNYAFWAMNNQRGYSNSRLYEVAKERVAKLMKGNVLALGIKRSDETKKLIADQATGAYHHNFKGYFVTPWGKFASAIVAANERISDTTIRSWCRNSKNLILSKSRFYQNTTLFKESDMGKPLFELGFSFEKAERVIPKTKSTSSVVHK